MVLGLLYQSTDCEELAALTSLKTFLDALSIVLHPDPCQNYFSANVVQ